MGKRWRIALMKAAAAKKKQEAYNAMRQDTITSATEEPQSSSAVSAEIQGEDDYWNWTTDEDNYENVGMSSKSVEKVLENYLSSDENILKSDQDEFKEKKDHDFAEIQGEDDYWNWSIDEVKYENVDMSFKSVEKVLENDLSTAENILKSDQDVDMERTTFFNKLFEMELNLHNSPVDVVQSDEVESSRAVDMERTTFFNKLFEMELNLHNSPVDVVQSDEVESSRAAFDRKRKGKMVKEQVDEIVDSEEIQIQIAMIESLKSEPLRVEIDKNVEDKNVEDSEHKDILTVLLRNLKYEEAFVYAIRTMIDRVLIWLLDQVYFCSIVDHDHDLLSQGTLLCLLIPIGRDIKNSPIKNLKRIIGILKAMNNNDEIVKDDAGPVIQELHKIVQSHLPTTEDEWSYMSVIVNLLNYNFFYF